MLNRAQYRKITCFLRLKTEIKRLPLTLQGQIRYAFYVDYNQANLCVPIKNSFFGITKKELRQNPCHSPKSKFAQK